MEYIGDKVMPDQPVIRVIESHLPAPKFIFIYRDLLHVASSFAARARNPEDSNWPASRDHKAAVQRWNTAFAAADALIDRIGLERVWVVRYDDLLNGDIRTCERMFGFLDLRASPSVRRTYEARTADWGKRQSKPLSLSRDETEFVVRHIDREALDRFDLRVEEQLDGA